LVKNDGLRIRVVCDNQIPVFTESLLGGSTGPTVDTGVGPSGSSGPLDRGSKRKRNDVGTSDDVDDQCPWVLYVGKDKLRQNWIVKTHKEKHTCLQSREIKHCTYKYLANKIYDLVKVNPEIPGKAVQDQLQRELHLQVSMKKAFRAKAKAEKDVAGDHNLQYMMLRDYIGELLSTNPNTTVKLAIDRDSASPSEPRRVFKRIYVCLGPLKEGYKACKRELLGLDGCFLKGPYPGQVGNSCEL
jgi:hypothetical protein